MTNDLAMYGGGSRREVRTVSRAVARAEARGLLRQTTLDQEVALANLKIDALTTATGQALGAVAKVAQAETALVQNFPGASGRLAFISERHMLAVGDVLDDLQYKLRRL